EGVGERFATGGIVGAGREGKDADEWMPSALVECPMTDSNAERNSSAVWNRSSGALASARVMTVSHHSGRSLRYARTGVGGSHNCFWTIPIGVSAWNGKHPVSSR